MDTVVSILLYMNVLTGSGNYTMEQLNNFAVIYAPQISVIENTPGELPPILEAFEPEAIVIIDGTIG